MIWFFGFLMLGGAVLLFLWWTRKPAAPTRVPVVHPGLELEAEPNVAPGMREVLREADRAFRRGELARAEELYVQVAGKDLYCAHAYGRIAEISLESGDNLEDGREAAEYAARVEPRSAAWQHLAARIAIRQERYTDAQRFLEQAGRMGEAGAAHDVLLGDVYLALRQFAKASAAYHRAARQVPSNREYQHKYEQAKLKDRHHKAIARGQSY